MSAIQLESYQDNADGTGCVALWRAVLFRLLCDACYELIGGDRTRRAMARQKHQGYSRVSRERWCHASHARNFLLANKVDFVTVCHLADIEPAYMRKYARRTINQIDLEVKVSAQPLAKSHTRSETPTNDIPALQMPAVPPADGT